MKNFKQIIAKQISKTIEINAKELEGYIETPKDSKNGDYAFPCFRLAKELRKAPPAIASEIKEKLEPVEEIEKVVEEVIAETGASTMKDMGKVLFYKQINISRRSIRRNIKDRAIWKINSGRRKKHCYRLFSTQYCKAISYRPFTFNSNRWSTIQYIQIFRI